MGKYLIIHGPNLNLLGVREPEIYGNLTLNQLNSLLMEYGAKNNISLEIFQSNCEGEIISKLHTAKEFDGIVINPAAFTHYSIAIYDAILAISIPVIEVHISNVHQREDFRRHSVTAPACIGQINGFGHLSYILALEAFLKGGQII